MLIFSVSIVYIVNHAVSFFLMQNEYSGSGFSEIDPNKINLQEYPNVAKVPWTYATLTPGDCIYIPAGTC